MNDKLVVGIADMKMAQGSGMLVTYALGSCIGICFYDPMLKLAALLHIMLPLNLETGRKSPLKYADTGIRETLRSPAAGLLFTLREYPVVYEGSLIARVLGGSV